MRTRMRRLTRRIVAAIGRRLGLWNGPFRPDRAYYINLEQRTDRRAFMENQLPSLGIPYSRWPAVRLDSLTSDPWARAIEERGIAPYVLDGASRLPTVGCYLSHVSLLDHVARNGSPQALVLEDDVAIDAGFVDRARVLVGQLPAFDLVLFDCFGTGHPPDRVETDIYRPSRSFPHYRGTHAVLVGEGRADHVLRVLRSRQIMDIDGLYLTAPELACFVVHTGGVRSGGFGSDRAARRPPR